MLPYPLRKYCARPLLPFLNRPFIEFQIEKLRDDGFDEIGLALSPTEVSDVSAHLGDGSSFGVSLTYRTDATPMGPAGVLRLFREFVGEETFLVTEGTAWLGRADLKSLVAAHHRHDAVATLAMNPAPEGANLSEQVSVGEGGRIEAFELLHPARSHRHASHFGGAYVFEPSVFDSIAADGYVDIKEQLLPDLTARGFLVRAESIDGLGQHVDSSERYHSLQAQLLADRAYTPSAYKCHGCDVFVAPDAQVDDSAVVQGPVLIGHGCVVEAGARVVGPAVLGDGVRIGVDAVVQESLLWSGSTVGSGARFEHGILGFNRSVRSHQTVAGEILMNGVCRTGAPFSRARMRTDGTVAPVLTGRVRAKRMLAHGAKRLMDLVVASVALLLGWPLLALLAVLVKWDSPGPALFVQKRCGRNGKEFKMYKFRTMVHGAEKLQEGLRAIKTVDGPMFKLENDPRVTRVGGFLRRNSLDELPQLYNVLKGEMSLVGPRPLAIEEMRCSPQWRDLRLTVQPGITGLWQINGRSATGFHDWVRHDIDYVQNWTLGMDVKVLAKTANWIVRRTGAY